MLEEIKQVIDNTAQFATDVNSLRNELLLAGEFNIHEEFPVALLDFANELIDRYHTFHEITSTTEEEEFDFVPDEEERDATPLETARYLIETDTRSLAEFASDAGMTGDTVKRFLEGTTQPYHKTLRKIELALGLTEGVLDE